MIAAAVLPMIAPRTQPALAATTTADATQAAQSFSNSLQAVVEAGSTPSEDGKKPRHEKSDPKDASVTTAASDPTQIIPAPTPAFVPPTPLPQPATNVQASSPSPKQTTADTTPMLPVNAGALSFSPAVSTPKMEPFLAQVPPAPVAPAATPQTPAAPTATTSPQPHRQMSSAPPSPGLDVPPPTLPVDTTTPLPLTPAPAPAATGALGGSAAAVKTPAPNAITPPADVKATAKILTAVLPLPTQAPAAPALVDNNNSITTAPAPAVPATAIHQLANLIQANSAAAAPTQPTPGNQEVQKTDPSPNSATDPSATAVSTNPKQHSQSDSGSSNSSSSQDAPTSSQAAPTLQPAAPAHFAVTPQDTTAAAQPLNTPAPPAPHLHDAPKSLEPAIHSAPAADPALPTINTARLIQTANQSEMRVGLRSTDFGNISISTSTTRNAISAQISLDHGELAKTLVAHLPEMQARLGGERAMEIRIDMNGQSAGQAFSQGQGNPSGMAYTSSGSNITRQPRAGLDPQPQTPAQPAMETSAARLDIRI